MGRPPKDAVVFKDAAGSEANQHSKKLAQEKSKKKPAKYPAIYSQKGLKVVKVTIKPNGQYQEYVGSLAKTKTIEAQMLKGAIAQWAKDGVWVPEHALEQYASDKIAELQAAV